MKACVVGATGRTGRRIVEELVRREIPVRAVVRNLERGREVLPPAAELVVGDVLQPESLKAAIADCTVVLCATGAAPSFDPTGPYKTDLEGTKNLVDACKAQGIQHVVLVSSLCVSKLFHPLNLFWLILVWKKQAEEYLQQSGLTYTIVRPGGLLEDDLPDAVVMQGADTLFDGRIPRKKVAEVCVEALTLPEARNKIVEVVARPDAPARSYGELFGAIA
ncbi:SDR family oxidoreductase [Thermoleptolyngbya sp. M55_K2018_002]|uniref:SDR family oxidoreductase n=1 Tax=Thermoleptolyngbya sp. M55_K2018_002 TaxID=2747808 RepID=UPI001A0766F2|nr:SDR family oxidoreductase [Thermoleptolyngbya sp. M55_K2018_002]HIK41619.1 SDR family oxidoreductase [Thermoleptolyngbya sp. M55_K2018_002]